YAHAGDSRQVVGGRVGITVRLCLRAGEVEALLEAGLSLEDADVLYASELHVDARHEAEEPAEADAEAGWRHDVQRQLGPLVEGLDHVVQVETGVGVVGEARVQLEPFGGLDVKGHAGYRDGAGDAAANTHGHDGAGQKRQDTGHRDGHLEQVPLAGERAREARLDAQSPGDLLRELPVHIELGGHRIADPVREMHVVDQAVLERGAEAGERGERLLAIAQLQVDGSVRPGGRHADATGSGDHRHAPLEFVHGYDRG